MAANQIDTKSQCKLILFYLKEHGKITAKDAMQLCGCMRLAARIHDLRSKGIPIKTKNFEYRNTAGNKVRYAIYSLEVQDDNRTETQAS